MKKTNPKKSLQVRRGKLWKGKPHRSSKEQKPIKRNYCCWACAPFVGVEPGKLNAEWACGLACRQWSYSSEAWPVMERGWFLETKETGKLPASASLRHVYRPQSVCSCSLSSVVPRTVCSKGYNAELIQSSLWLFCIAYLTSQNLKFNLFAYWWPFIVHSFWTLVSLYCH